MGERVMNHMIDDQYWMQVLPEEINLEFAGEITCLCQRYLLHKFPHTPKVQNPPGLAMWSLFRNKTTGNVICRFSFLDFWIYFFWIMFWSECIYLLNTELQSQWAIVPDLSRPHCSPCPEPLSPATLCSSGRERCPTDRNICFGDTIN